MVQKFYRGLKIFGAQKFLFFKNFQFFAKVLQNFAKNSKFSNNDETKKNFYQDSEISESR